MSYNKKEFPKVMETAGKITILTALTGVLVFMVMFVFDAGTQQLSKVSAQTATTTLTVLNTPPAFSLNAREVVDSSTTTPTNSGTNIQWRAIGTDSNNAPYFLLVCATNASPTARSASNINNLGTNPPVCGGGPSVQWGVSTATQSGAEALVSTTTLESFPEQNNWFAWVCDDDPVNPRCNSVPVQGPTSTTAFSSPFNVNYRPVLTSFANNGPVNPGATITFTSVSSDPNVVNGDDDIFLVVCQNNGGINPVTRTCNSGGLASTTGSFKNNANALYALAAIVRDDSYPAFAYLVDQHGHQATANPVSNNFVVNNVAPQVLGGDISLNNGNNIVLTTPGNETTGFRLDFTVRDANSCVNATNGPEITGYTVAVYRSGIGTSTCNGSAGSYNPNNCYPSGAPQTTWNLNCTASTTSCTGPTDDTQIFNCTFPLWFVADPTDAGPNTPASLASNTWLAAVSGRDDNNASGPLVATSQNSIELISFTALDLLTAQIPYGALEPGMNSGTLNASTTVASVGNTGLDQDVRGDSMCPTYSVGNPCAPSATSTVPESEQRFSTTTLAYTSPLALTLSSTTAQKLDINVRKTTSTSTPQIGVTYWGIAVPLSITLAGSYRGLNTFIGRTAEAIDWGI